MTLIGRMFHVSYSVEGSSRHGERGLAADARTSPGLRPARLPGPTDPRPHPARRLDRPGLGQCPLAPDQAPAGVHRNNIGLLAAADLRQITRAVKRRLKMLQYRPEVIDGCLAGTDLVMDV
ncbi:hypothetical protein ACFWNT_40560 [Streptomyces sp. NPDC058409]|uniref:hypothetical protein n=1 Tax=Streptomyces sp. NPDC058409 TaxID=3346484 RepID=UPI003651EA40